MKKAPKVAISLLLASSVVLSFAAFSNATVLPNITSSKAKNVILLIGDGMGSGQMTAGRIVKGSSLAMDSITYNGTVSTYPNDPKEKWVTDSAAAGTAIATGTKTYNAAISVDPNKKPVETILELAQEKGKSTGLVSTTRITHATPAVFAAHNPNRDAETEIAADMLNHNVDVLLGGGLTQFLPTSQGGKRTDNKNLVDDAKKMGYTFVSNKDEMNNANGKKLLGLFNNSHDSYEIDRNPAKEPSLSEQTQKSIDILSKNNKGFFLMVEGGRIDHASHANDAATAAKDVIAFDNAVKVALDYAKKNRDTLVIVTADHETGGMTIGGYGQMNFNPDVLKNQTASFEDVISKQLKQDNVQEMFSKYLGVNDLTTEELNTITSSFAKNAGAITAADTFSKRALVGWTTTAHTGEDMPIMAYGPKADRFSKHLDNTDIFKLMKEAMYLY